MKSKNAHLHSKVNWVYITWKLLLDELFPFLSEINKIKRKLSQRSRSVKIFFPWYLLRLCVFTHRSLESRWSFNSLVPCCAGSRLDGKGRLPVSIFAAACSREEWHASHFQMTYLFLQNHILFTLRNCQKSTSSLPELSKISDLSTASSDGMTLEEAWYSQLC